MYYLIGHRGVGKTTIASNINDFFKVLDLDREIELKAKKPVFEIFESNGEEFFRSLELETLNEILRNDTSDEIDLIVLGAGFDLSRLEKKNETDKVLWMRRESDSLGRVFLNRPRLDSSKEPLKEYLNRFSFREKLYRECSDFEFFVEENDLKSGSSLLLSILKEEKLNFKGRITYSVDKSIFEYLSYEYRTDLTPENEILKRLKKGDLVSIRTKVDEDFIEKIIQLDIGIEIDLPIEDKNKFPIIDEQKDKVFLSSHNSLSVDQIRNFNNEGFHIKWAPKINSFDELMAAHRIFKDCDVSFLPRFDDKNSHWQWYRALTHSLNRIKFFRFSEGSDINQPYWYQVGKGVDSSSPFKGCVMGSPIKHSFSPAFHKEFFKGNYFKIEIDEKSLSFEVLNFLSELSLKCFSITSPLKKKTSKLINVEKPVNTLYKEGLKVFSYNTDVFAIDKIVDELKHKKVLIWGAGAIGEQFFEKLPTSKLFSIREWRDEEIKEEFDVLIWCAGSRKIYPKLSKNVERVYDVDYTDKSEARVYALKNKISYKSGLEFFNIQALKQQEWWMNQINS